MTKRWIAVTLASAFAVASAGAIAESPSSRPVSKAVQMSEAELDEITAGSAVVEVILANPGNADVRNRTVQINPVPGVEVDRAVGTVMVTTGNGTTFTRCIGSGSC